MCSAWVWTCSSGTNVIQSSGPAGARNAIAGPIATAYTGGSRRATYSINGALCAIPERAGMSRFSSFPVRNFEKKHGGNPKSSFTTAQIRAFNLHGWHCHYCGALEPLTVDHIHPVAKGGRDVESNYVPACFSCNSAKGKRSYDVFMLCVQAEIAAYEMSVVCGMEP